ncbi:hypothetical protein CDD81_7397 [Ophiocordyceps australis]|uniref:MAGE domain-containing protein n=1 Tax=Ophiocordyceps australis TaxID=1399860 RepID=A0A2C5YGC0_9HYPO|nr:hypothetical protein CDD81_7397 [Ophiocordyceps australis]
MPIPHRRRRLAEDEDEEDEGLRQGRTRADSDEDGYNGSDDGDAMQEGRVMDSQLAKKLVRYAISCEFSRTPIRRDGIKERVLGDQGRSFRRVFKLAQEQLQLVWGMELRELPVREKMTLQEKRQAMKSNSQVKTGSGAYILSSTLPESLRSASILEPSKAPSAGDEATYIAFYTLVVSVIWLNGGELTDQKLKRYLMRLNADQNVSGEKTETTLKRMEKHGYVMRKVERPPIGQDGEQNINWYVGPRGKEEVGLDGVMGMVREVYGDWGDDMERKLHSSLGIKPRAATEGQDGDRGGGEDGDGNDCEMQGDVEN